MARKFNNTQPANKNQGASYSTSPGRSPGRGNRIQKDTKKDNPKINTHQPKPQSQTSNPPPTSQKFPPPPPNKSLTESGKNNLAKLASINKLMGGNLTTPNIKAAKQTQIIPQSNPKTLIKKPSPQQVLQALQSLKDLQKLLDSYEELEMDQNCNLKALLQFMQNKQIKQAEKQEKIQA